MEWFRFVTEEATNFLFKEANSDFGQDLVARFYCNLENITTRKIYLIFSYRESPILLGILMWSNFAQEYPTRPRSWLAWIQLMEKALWTEKHIKAVDILKWRHFSLLLIYWFFPQHGHSTCWDYRGAMGCVENSILKSWRYWPLCCRTGDYRKKNSCILTGSGRLSPRWGADWLVPPSTASKPCSSKSWWTETGFSSPTRTKPAALLQHNLRKSGKGTKQTFECFLRLQ